MQGPQNKINGSCKHEASQGIEENMPMIPYFHPFCSLNQIPRHGEKNPQTYQAPRQICCFIQAWKHLKSLPLIQHQFLNSPESDEHLLEEFVLGLPRKDPKILPTKEEV